MSINGIIMMVLILMFFWGGFIAFIIKLQKISKAQELES